jgi:predicted transcriptional regulator
VAFAAFMKRFRVTGLVSENGYDDYKITKRSLLKMYSQADSLVKLLPSDEQIRIMSKETKSGDGSYFIYITMS